MRRGTQLGLLSWLACAALALAQVPNPTLTSLPATPSSNPPVRALVAQPPAAPALGQAPAAGTPEEKQDLAALQRQLERTAQEVQRLKEEQAKTKDAKEVEKLQKQVEILQKQIEVLQKIVKLLVEQVKKPEAQIATLEARGLQAAQRDQELASAVDDLREQADAERRNGPELPAPLKELFLPSGTNETPLSFYGVLTGNYHKFPHSSGAGEFEFEEFAPWFLLQLNDWIQLEVELFAHADGAGVDQGQIDFLVNDWLTVVAGRYIGPAGWFNERVHPSWINKLPDFPLVFRQVAPADYSLNGIQLRGSHYLGCLPVKMEYALFAGNGFGLPEGATPTGVANLEAQKDSTSDINESMAYGGRLGLWLPELGFATGVSLFANTPYTIPAASDITLWELDANYRKGNWDFRFEYANMVQGTRGITDDRIRRRGWYAQVAYRPYDALDRFLQKAEGVFRYSRARFNGIDPTALDLAVFESPIDVPVDRDQYTFGINYYFYPSLVLKFAYEINHEVGDLQLKDNLFTAQLAWGF